MIKLDIDPIYRLVCGDIESNFDAVFNKVKSLSAKTNFAFLLCVGNVLSDDSTGSLDDYKTGKKKGKKASTILVLVMLPNIPF